MNKQLTEGKRLAELASKGIWEDFVAFHSPEALLNIYAHIEKLEAENKKLKKILLDMLPMSVDKAKEALKGES